MPILLRATALGVAGVLSISSSGCTLLGARIGATNPRASDVEMPLHIEAVPRGSEVKVVYYQPVDNSRRRSLESKAPSAARKPTATPSSSGATSVSIPLSRIEDTRARPPTGSYATEGALVGRRRCHARHPRRWMLAHYQPGYD